MWQWVYKTLLNRRNIAPPMRHDVPCDIPGCTTIASEQWFPTVCALREAGIVVDWVNVCAEHDVQANEDTVRFFFGPKYDVELAQYRADNLLTSFPP